MKTSSFIGMASAIVATGLSASCFAGARGGVPMVRPMSHIRMVAAPHAWGGMRWAHSLPPVSGTWHVRTGATYFTRFGHTNTAVFGHFHTFGPRNGFVRNRPFVRYARSPLRFRYGLAVPGYAGAGGYAGNIGAGPSYSSGADYGAGQGGYAEPPLAVTYGEPPLGQGSYAEAAEAQSLGFGPQGGYNGGPQIIVINNNVDARPHAAGGCSCSRGSASPVVYRFGVGSYY